MAFITQTDLHTSIIEEELIEITRGDTLLITAACDAAQEEMNLYLYDNYETETIFAQTGNARHALLLQLGIDIAIYFVIARCQNGQEIDDRKARYDRAVKMLQQFKKSETYSNIPRREATKQEMFKFGSNLKRNQHY
jgi:phage gp36-like protein